MNVEKVKKKLKGYKDSLNIVCWVDDQKYTFSDGYWGRLKDENDEIIEVTIPLVKTVSKYKSKYE